MKECILVSACLLGENTKYNGGNNYTPLIEKLKEKYIIIPICPEVMGGLTTPRLPSEINNDKIINKAGVDVTAYFKKGASDTLEISKKNSCRIAILKESSPSCGVNTIYDGTFSSTKIKGMGVTAKLLKDNSMILYTENDLDKLLNN